ncbi:BA75_02363T0 [Komagataella pastoris]|uniref:Large ribosomal subunit protein uL4m n=1 Tax=Komagataella pastoris TaxID=4922 RepID=A0A1B2JCM2_PICPA|nr:BA75_02363T0 [Komagataella pastoris]
MMALRRLRVGFRGYSTYLVNAIPKAPTYLLSTVRSFPSLEPHTVLPISTEFLNSPLRRDLLWKAVVMELDNIRVGASNPPGRGEHKFSRKKLRPQKGSGRARVGDANSPTRHNGARALARTAPNDFSTEIPFKVYARAYRIALSSFYNKGHLHIIGGCSSLISFHQGDQNILEISTDKKEALEIFRTIHNLKGLNILFISDSLNSSQNLNKAIRALNDDQVSLMDKENVEVRHLLRANRVFIEQTALQFFAKEFAG